MILINQNFVQVTESLKRNKEIIIGILIGICIIMMIVFKKCQIKSTSPQTKNLDFCLNLNKKYSDFTIDSAVLNSYLISNNLSTSIQKDMKEFYTHRGYQFAWFNQCGLASAASTFYELVKNYQSEFNDKTVINIRLDSLLNLALDDEKSFLRDWTTVSELELKLTSCFFLYAQKVYGGSTVNTTKLSWFIPRNKKDYQGLLDSLLSSTIQSDFEEPLNPYYISLKKKLLEYKKIEKSNLYTLSAVDKLPLKLGDTNQGLVNIKQQLFLTGDIKTQDKTQIFNSEFESGIKSFQNRMGLNVTGIIDKNTINQLNIPISNRIKQIIINLERLRWVPPLLTHDYILVNIPEFRLHVFENNKPIFNMNVIVGKTLHKTVIFEGKISSVVINPYWNIPSSIVKKEIISNISRNQNYLSNNNIEVIRETGSGNLLYRQKPGPNNALGRIKFLFPNHYNIYLHDAPAKSLFEANTRAFSHGCIRVADARKLALFILNKQKEWSDTHMDEILNTNEEKQIAISPPIPVFIVYFTTWVDQYGALHFRNDIYSLDKRLEKEIFGE